MSETTFRKFDPWRPAPVKEESRQQIMQSHYFNVDQVSFDSSKVGHFERFIVEENNGDTVGIIGLTDDGRIPLVEQYRLPTHRWTLEIPAGHAMDSNERPHDVAVRKLREEAGYEAKELVQVVRFINTPSFSTQHTAVFFATGLTAVERGELGPETPRPDVRLVTPEEASDMILNGTIIDAKTIIAVMRLREHLAAEEAEHAGAHPRLIQRIAKARAERKAK
ncbi:NUDIX hydrolase [Bifidobacterium thermacidophilum]|uniref:NUDIX hydrolase n=1 Tax=Bifidobacterium thermacidophilum TaxID=246618 RepID=A0ABW8KPF0_9BIFI